MKIIKMFDVLIWNNIYSIGQIIIFSAMLLIIYIMWFDKPKSEIQTVNTYQSSFDLTKIPTGMVVWKHGVPGTEMDFIHADSSARYEFFDIGVVTKEMIVYQIRIPFYALSMFNLGFPVNYKIKPNKNGLYGNPTNDSYVYKNNKTKKIINN